MKNPRVKHLWRMSIFAALLLLIALAYGTARLPRVQNDQDEGPDSCTSIMVGRLASTDGSVMTAHTCDGNYRNWLNVVPHQKYDKGANTKVYWGTLHTESAWDLKGKIQKGEIPQVEETYAYLNTAYPCLNEKQLAIGETTIRGRQELYNDEGLFLIEELERIALERCKTAREAIKLIGELVKKYGYGDSGECITIADPKEVWQFEIFGAGPAEPGAVWAAERIPDDHIGVSANIPRISELKLDDPDRFMASDNVFSVAEEMGWWKKGEPFKFWNAYSGRKPFADREFFILSTLAPSLNLKMDDEELPFSVKPAKQLSVEDVMRYYRETYEGTEMDMTRNLMVPKSRPNMGRRKTDPEADEKPAELVKSPIASAWMSNDMIALLNTLKPGTVERRRTVAIAACAYSEIIQCRSWLPDEVGGVAWFSFDNPAESPRFPIFSGVLSLPDSFEIDSQHRYQPNSASWAFRRTNRLAAIKWGQTRKQVEDAIAGFQGRALVELPAVEKIAQQYLNSDDPAQGRARCRQYLTGYTNDFARAAMEKWTELGDTFWGLYARGF
jgi:dipeptidase